MKEKIFSKNNLIWGICGIILFSIISIILLYFPYHNTYPLPNITLPRVLFLLLNWTGMIIISFISAIKTNYYYAIVLSMPFYYLIGILIKKMIKK